MFFAFLGGMLKIVFDKTHFWKMDFPISKIRTHTCWTRSVGTAALDLSSGANPVGLNFYINK